VPERAARDAVAVLPLAATEQHGPHLPVSTDLDIGMGLLAAARRHLPDDVAVQLLPPISVGASQEHARFPGTLSVSTEELIRSIVEQGATLARSGVRRLVLSNSHGGNRHAMDAAALSLRADHGLLVVKASWFRFARPTDVDLPETEWRHGLHGGAVETAMMLHLRPDLVRTEAIADFPSLGAELERTLRRLGPEGQASFAWLAEDLNPLGVVGDATLATAAMGAHLVEHYGRILAEVILDAQDFRLDRLSPGPERDAGGGVGSPIDARTAWDLVRAVVPGSVERAGTVRVRLDADPDAWLDVHADGSWRASGDANEAARDIFDVYLPVRITRELVMGQLGQSLDGRIATEGGASRFVTGPKDIERLHRLRSLVDAVIVGAATVAHDDPRLTVRLVEGPNPVRVVLDPSGQLDASRRVFSESGAPTLVVRRAPAASQAAGPAPGAILRGSHEELNIPGSDPDGLDLAVLLAELRARGLRRILVEGGGVTVSRFLQAGLLDRLHITVAPMLVGSGRPSITLDPIASLDQALRPACRRFTLGEDLLFDLDLRSGSA
jgi:creatinine amidohydrolase